MSLCDGLYRSCHRRLRCGKLQRKSYVQCKRGCEVRQCVNYAVCETNFITNKKTDKLCQRCIFFASSKHLRKKNVNEQCAVCLDTDVQKYELPQCNHSFCAPCTKELLFRSLPNSGAPTVSLVAASLDPILFTNSQQCPLCRRVDTRTPWERHQAVLEARCPGPDEAWATNVRCLMVQCATLATQSIVG